MIAANPLALFALQGADRFGPFTLMAEGLAITDSNKPFKTGPANETKAMTPAQLHALKTKLISMPPGPKRDALARMITKATTRKPNK